MATQYDNLGQGTTPASPITPAATDKTTVTPQVTTPIVAPTNTGTGTSVSGAGTSVSDPANPGLDIKSKAGNGYYDSKGNFTEGTFDASGKFIPYTPNTNTVNAYGSTNGSTSPNIPATSTTSSSSDAASAKGTAMLDDLTAQKAKIDADMQAQQQQEILASTAAISDTYGGQQEALKASQAEETATSAALQHKLGREGTDFATSTASKLLTIQNQRIKDLTSAQNAAILAATQAIKSNDFALADKKKAEAQSLFDDRMKIVADQRAATAADYTQQLQKSQLATAAQTQQKNALDQVSTLAASQLTGDPTADLATLQKIVTANPGVGTVEDLYNAALEKRQANAKAFGPTEIGSETLPDGSVVKKYATFDPTTNSWKPMSGGGTELDNNNIPSSSANAPGTVGGPHIDISVPGYTTNVRTDLGGLTQAAIDAAAVRYAIDGTLPAGARATKGPGFLQQTAIKNRAAELDAGGQITTNKERLAGMSAKMIDQAKVQGDIETATTRFEGIKALVESDLLNVNKQESPLRNELQNMVSQKLLGSDALGKFDTSLAALRSIYSVVFGGGTQTDKTIDAANAALPADISAKDLKDRLDRISIEGKIATDTNKQEQENISKDMNNIIGGGDLYGKNPAQAGANSSQSYSTLDDFVKGAVDKKVANDLIDSVGQKHKDWSDAKILNAINALQSGKSEPLSMGQNGSIQLGSHLAQVNNNPGNLRFVGQPGAVNGEKGFAKFQTPEAGLAAMKTLLTKYSSSGHTLASMINKYAPPSENDTNTYVSQMAKALGVDPNTPLSKINLDKLVQAMAQKESSSIIS